jgi:hypothetical protein
MIVIVFDPLAVLLLMAASMPIKKEEKYESPTSSEEGSNQEEADSGEENHYEEDKSNIDRIKERFFRRFGGPEPTSTRIEPTTEPSVEQRATESTTIIGDELDPSAGIRVETTDFTSTPVGLEEGKEPDWQINPPPAEETSPLYSREVLDTDSAGRVTSALPPDFIVDWSNKDGKPRAVPKNS